MAKKSIFITGAAMGIGKATAQHFARQGWFVGLLDMNEKELQTLAGELGPDNCSTHVADVREVGEIENAITEFGSRTQGNMHVLFNNAGILSTGGFEKVSLETHKAIVDVNITGQMNVTLLALPLLKASGKSAIVSMCSASALYGNPELTSYAATKSAVMSLTEGWNLLFEKYGIHVTDILTAYVRTAMVSNIQETTNLPDTEVKLTADDIAKAVWKAAHSKKLHHYVGMDAKVFRLIKWLMPQFVIDFMVKKVIYKDSLKAN